MKTGIMGGTFDPIHHGHLFLAKEVLYYYQLDRVVFVPSKRGPHKREEKHTAAQLRYEMVFQAILDQPQFEISDIEITRAGLSYTIDTITAMKNRFRGDEMYFITGADSIVTIESWKSFEYLLDRVVFIAATRPSLSNEAFISEIERIRQRYQATIHVMDMLGLEISSSEIRKRVKRGQPITYLVPKTVEQMIESEALYV